MYFQQTTDSTQQRPVLLDCEAEGEPLPTYSWMKNGQPFSVAGSDERLQQQPGRGSLVITRPRDIDEGLYQCMAKNEHGIAVSNAVYLRQARTYYA